jgi:hypothetical protein
MSFDDELAVNPACLDVQQRERCAMDAIERAGQVLRQGDVLPRMKSQIDGLATNRDYLTGKLKFLSTAPSDGGQRGELQRGIDQVDQQLEHQQEQYNQLVGEMNAANAERAKAGRMLTQCAQEKIELSRRS